MRLWILRAADAGLDRWPDSTVIPAGAIAQSPDDADILWCPSSLSAITRMRADAVQLAATAHGAADRTGFFDCADFNDTFDLPSLFIRCDARGFMRRAAPHTYGFPWPVEDLRAISHATPLLDLDVSFVGWATPRYETRLAATSVYAETELASKIILRHQFFGYVERDNPSLAAVNRQEYLEALYRSRLVLVPQSIEGVFRYRYWEALSAGRVPVLFVSGEPIWPFDWEWHWSECSFVFEAALAASAGKLCRRILETHNDERLIAMGKRGREIYERWLCRARWSELVSIICQRHLAQPGARM